MKMAVKRVVIVLFGLIFQISISLAVYLLIISHIEFEHANILYSIIGILMILYLIKDNRNYSYTLPWIILILLFPLIGTLLYIIIGNNKRRSKTLKKIKLKEKESNKYLIQNDKITKEIEENNRLKYMLKYTKYPISMNNDLTYYKSGEDVFPTILEELKKAKSFIFIEFFIINHGVMWDSILNILEKKAASGVDVRVMYDDFGCIKFLESNYYKELENKGIKCVVFNKLNPFAGIIMNNRDHRKIIVIDGKVAFSGGINLADEYINIGSKYGYWKDNAIKITGDAVYNYTVMFLTMYNAFNNIDKDFTKFKYNFNSKRNKKSYVVPYSETPLDKDGNYDFENIEAIDTKLLNDQLLSILRR